MKVIIPFVLLVALLMPHSALCAGSKNGSAEKVASRIRIVFGDQEVIVRMFDNPASNDFMSLLPLRMDFEDFAGKEKTSYPPRKLDTSGSPTANNAEGDFTYYAPWGNLAVFYRGFGKDGQLYVLGRIESGKEKLAAQRGGFAALVEKIE